MIEFRVLDNWRVLAGTLLTLALMPIPAPAATDRVVIVDPIVDDDPDSGCTLREAIDLANAGLLSAIGCTATEIGTGLPLNYRLELPAYTYTLTGMAGEDNNLSGDLDILSTLSIVGAGSEATVIDGGRIDRLFHLVSAVVSLSIDGVTLQNGHETLGGAILNEQATLSISNSVLQNNTASSGAMFVANGGAVHTFAGTLTINNSILMNNLTDNRGGAIYTLGRSGVQNDSVTITNSSIVGNSAGGGGGIYIGSEFSTVAISGSDISNNQGGGLVLHAIGISGGIPTVSIVGSSIMGNQAESGGGIHNAKANLNLANSSLIGNSAKSHGGGLYSSWSVRLTHATVSLNVADADGNGSGDGGGIYREEVGTKALVLNNSILAKNMDLGGEQPDCSGTINTARYNLIGINGGCSLTFVGGSPNSNNDFVGTEAIPLDAKLGRLAGDPGFLLLSKDSPAIDKVPLVDCQYISVGTNPLYGEGETVTTDQRGAPRDDALCDIGAVESQLLFSDGFE